MIASIWQDLALTSLRDPAEAARRVMAMRLPREALWTGLVLVAVLNTLLFVVSDFLVQGPSPLPTALNTPLFYFGLVAGGLILSSYAIFWVGRALGGTGTLPDIMALIVWLQVLRVAVQAVVLVLVLTIPLLSALLVMAATLYGMFILLHFINQAHALDSLWRAAGILIASVLAIVLGLSLLLSLVGGPIIGASASV